MSGGDEVQGLGRQMLLGLYMLTRSVKIYSTDNAIFLKPLQALLEQVNKIIALESKIDLALVGPSLYINSRLIRIDQASLENLKQLAHTFRNHRIGGFTLVGRASLEDLRNFFHLFTTDAKDDLPDDGLPGHKLQGMRLRKWAAHQEKAQGDQASLAASPADAHRRLGVAVYARALLWADYQARCAREGRGEDATSTSIRVAQDLVDAHFDLKGEFLPLLVNGTEERAVAHHLVNTTVIAVAFGSQIGLDKVQLKDIAVAALNNEVQVAKLPPSSWLPADPEKLAPEQRSQRAGLWRDAAQFALGSRAGSRLNQLRALSVVQMHEPYLVSVRDAAGKAETKPRTDILFVSRLLAIAAHYDVLTSPSGERPAYAPDQALGAMWGPLRYRFEPELLWVFVRSMAHLPLKVTSRKFGGVFDPATAA